MSCAESETDEELMTGDEVIALDMAHCPRGCFPAMLVIEELIRAESGGRILLVRGCGLASGDFMDDITAVIDLFSQASTIEQYEEELSPETRRTGRLLGRLWTNAHTRSYCLHYIDQSITYCEWMPGYNWDDY